MLMLLPNIMSATVAFT